MWKREQCHQEGTVYQQMSSGAAIRREAKNKLQVAAPDPKKWTVDIHTEPPDAGDGARV